MKAAILAGGLGTRLHPLTINMPKPLLPVACKPIIEYLIEALKKYGFTDISMFLYYKSELFKSLLGDGSKYGVKIRYFVAEKDLGTAGVISLAKDFLDEDFLVISGDLVTDIDLSAIYKFHKKKKALATIGLTRVDNPLAYGIVILDRFFKVKKFLEKPQWGEVFSDTINAGIYMLSPQIFDFIPKGQACDFSQDVFPQILHGKKPLFGHICKGYWRDVGTLLEYAKVNREVMSESIDLQVKGEKLDDLPVWVGKNVNISHNAKILGQNVLCDEVSIADDAVLENTAIGRRSKVGRGSEIRGSVLMDNIAIGEDVKINNAIIGRSVVIHDRVNIHEGSVIADNCVIERDSEIRPYIRIWPNKVVQEGSQVSRNVIWRERWSKSLFGAYGVTGILNSEITPEFAASLGAAFGAMLGPEACIAISRDAHKSSRMISRALISGILSTGVNISNLEDVPIPITRFELKALNFKGGMHVRRSPFERNIMDIKFFDGQGLDIAPNKEKSIERLFFTEDFDRVDIESTGELTFPFHRIAEEYKEGFLANVNHDLVANSYFKVAIDYAYGSASKIFPPILGTLGCEVVAINAHIDETRITKSSDDFKKSLFQLSQIVKSLSANLGVMFDAGAEKVFLCDEKGNVLDGDTALAAVVMLVLRILKPKSIAVPVTASRNIEKIAAEYKTRVIRTRTSYRAMMEAAMLPEVAFVGENTGGFIFPEFIFSFDAMMSTIKILEFMAKEKVKLGEIVRQIPIALFADKEISCPPEFKGKVIRNLAEQEKNEVEMIDGIRIFKEEGSILVLPHADKPTIRLRAEAKTQSQAQKMVNSYLEKIDNILLKY